MKDVYEIKSGIFITKSGEAIEVKDGYYVKNMTSEEAENGRDIYFDGGFKDAQYILYLEFNPEYRKSLEEDVSSPRERQTISQDL
ncbi:hypothetical protein [uncultured Parasutterella sp.]|uniref:hypothetical protein n=1 Tax=uncultured Parasutterella sp. TaxID=1263098 RepID=UPI00272D9640|nr:hypothetical protein [uncultured Parasutterella sp.]